MNEETKIENIIMKIKIEIKSVFGDVLFEFEKENNSVKDTLIEAVKSGANLVGANLGESSKLQNTSDVLIVGLIGSRRDYTTIFHADKGVFVRCGCFKGTLDEFEAKVKKNHNGSKHEKDYLALIQFAKIKFDL